MSDILSSVSSLLQIILIVLVVALSFYLARRWRIRRLRALVRGTIPLTEEVKQAVAKLFTSDALEVAALGAVTYVDVAWQYSLADPQIWTYFDGATSGHAVDAMADPHLLEAGLGDHASTVLGHITDHYRQLEALQAFDLSLDNVMRLGTDHPNAVLLLEGHPRSLLDLLLHKDGAAAPLADANAQVLSDGKADALADAKVGALDARVSSLANTKVGALDAKANTLVDAKAGTLDAKMGALWDAKASSILDARDLWHHVPIITIGFATYRAWRRAENGTAWARNLEFATTEVVARAGGALAGAKVGGTVGTLFVPGYGTVVGSVVGAVSGAIAGARLSEEVKRRHVRQAQRQLDQALHGLGSPFMQDPVGYRRLTAVFAEQEKAARWSVDKTRREYGAYARWWRRLWPDEKLILMQETVVDSDARLREVRQQVRDTLDRVEVLRQQDNYQALGLILWNSPAMCRRLGCAEVLIRDVNRANERLLHEVQQMGAVPA